MRRFEDKGVIVTGSGRGIGRAIALAFASEGAEIVVNVRKSLEEADQVVREIEKLGGKGNIVQADVADREEATKMTKTALEYLGKIDVLVNNAGIGTPAMSYKMNSKQWSRIIDVNLTGVFNCYRSVIPHMIERRTGKIVNISSVAGIDGMVGNINYAASKGAINAFTRTAATEVGRYGINVNAVAPGLIKTKMTDWIKEPKYKDLYLTRIPLCRLGRPEEVASTVLFLASDEAKYITGQVIRVDGGILFPT